MELSAEEILKADEIIKRALSSEEWQKFIATSTDVKFIVRNIALMSKEERERFYLAVATDRVNNKATCAW